MLNHLSECIIHADQIKKWTDQDPTLSRVWRIVETGHIVPETSPELKPYVQCYIELSVLQGYPLKWSVSLFLLKVERLSSLNSTIPTLALQEWNTSLEHMFGGQT